MKTFYTLLLFFTRFDLAIARSTGRNPDHIAALCADERAYEKALWDLDHQLHIN